MRRARRANRTAVLTTVTAQSDPELFFGLRGGAPIFSIVVAMTVRTFPVPQQVRPPDERRRRDLAVLRLHFSRRARLSCSKGWDCWV